jgi:signal transduction histidine kinase/CheY-like chemotaxis protein
VASSLERMAVALATGTTQPNEFRLRRHDGEYRWHIVRAVPIRDETGAIEKWIGSNTDIHDQKMAQAALADYAARLEREVEARAARLRETEEALRHAQKMETIGNFAGGIAHDFNNLLQIIGSSLHLARYARPGDPKVAERIDGAVEAVRRAGRLTSQLLAFGRRQLLQPRPVRPAELLSGMDKILRGALGPEVNLTVDVAPDARQVLADPGNIENAILNLVLNARDAMPRGGALGVRVSNFAATDAGSLKPGEYVRIDVSDSGDGMSEATQEKIFEPFFSTKPIGQGSGMGLSMVYGFAQQSGGGVSVVSALGKGSVFSLFLPATDVIDNILSEPKAAASTRGRGETILVVDDEKAIRDTTISLLTNLGYRVMAAHDAAGALAALRSGVAFDLVVSDVVMPGPLTVEALLNELARSYPAIPVLLASGYPRDVLVSERGIAPDIEVIAKPYEEQRLAGAVRAALDRARAIEKPALEQPTTAADVFRVLVCEDQSFIRFDLMEAAQELGCEVIEAGNIETARDLLSTAPVDLLLTDIHLPDGSGVDVAMAARKIRPQMPVIFVTADPLAAPAGFARATLVQKPFTPRDLRRALANWLPAAMAEKGRRTEGD